ncbi:hypothetical protein PSN45_004229 [Yamadazyma tenuis]|nr:hypothetical protein PSN45_004229 [Yamadazyma tenuis]
MIIGFWASDYLSIQSYENPSSALIIGLSWRQAMMNSILGLFLIAIPITLNGVMGSDLHVPFAVANRASFGYLFSRFAIVTRFCTALFWHAIQTFSGSISMYYVIASIWPRFLDLENSISPSSGITSAQMVAHFVFFVLQFPIMTIPPHKLGWFFMLKIVIVVACLIGMVSGITKMSGGTGDIFRLDASLSGSAKIWATLHTLNSTIGGWATMSTNISDFTRYLKGSKSQYFQVVIIPVFAVFVTMIAIVCSSAAKVLYGEYIWDPTDFAAIWISTGPKGRAASFFMCFSWCLAQIGTNLSANVISAANDLTSLFPRFLNIRRSAIIVTITASWIMVPWKIVYSAGSLINFMSGISLFLAPIFSIMICDYWIVKKRKINVPELYNPHGIYAYDHGINWRAVVALVSSIVPNLPGLALSVNSNLDLPVAISRFATLAYFYGSLSAVLIYYLLNIAFPHKESLIGHSVWELASEIETLTSADDQSICINSEKQFF